MKMPRYVCYLVTTPYTAISLSPFPGTGRVQGELGVQEMGHTFLRVSSAFSSSWESRYGWPTAL